MKEVMYEVGDIIEWGANSNFSGDWGRYTGVPCEVTTVCETDVYPRFTVRTPDGRSLRFSQSSAVGRDSVLVEEVEWE